MIIILLAIDNRQDVDIAPTLNEAGTKNVMFSCTSGSNRRLRIMQQQPSKHDTFDMYDDIFF